MTVTELRPLSLGELLDRTFSYYRSHFWVFVGIMAIPQVFLVAVDLLRQALTRPGSIVGVNSQRSEEQFLTLGVGVIVGVTIVVVAYAFAYAAALGATTFALSRLHLGQSATIRGAYQSMRGHVWRLLKLLALVWLWIFGPFVLVGVGVGVAVAGLPVAASGARILAALLLVGLFVLAVPLAIWMALRYGVAVPALLLENLTARQALKRSALLTQGYKGRLFLIGFLMTLIAAVVALVFEGPLSVALAMLASKGGQISAWLLAAISVAGSLSRALSGPLLTIGIALAYYDLRVRKEGFDLQLMVAALGDAGPAPPSSAPDPAAPS